jgi:ribose transport system substrate-binding protein
VPDRARREREERNNMTCARKRPRYGLPLALGAALFTGLAGCGGQSSSSSVTDSPAASSTASSNSGVAYAKSQVAATMAVPQFTFKAPSFDISKISGKTIFNIPLTSAVPFVTDVDQQAAGIARKYGARWVEYTNQGTPTEWTTGINQAITQHASVIALSNSIPLPLIAPALQKAKAAGIPVVSYHSYQDGQLGATPPDGPGASVRAATTAFVTTPFWKAARLLADYVIAQTDGKADDVVFTSSEVNPAAGMATALLDEFHTRCPACKVTVINVPVAEWGTKLASDTQSALGSDPNINYVTPLFDSMSLFIQQGVTAAGKSGQVHIDSYNGTPAVMKLIQHGDVMSMDIGESVAWLGYSAMDQIGRVLAGAPPVSDGNEQTPLRIFDKSNISQAGDPPNATSGYGASYPSGYAALWADK